MPFPGHEEELGEIASFLSDTLCTQVRRTGDNEIETGRYRDPEALREAQRSAFEPFKGTPRLF